MKKSTTALYSLGVGALVLTAVATSCFASADSQNGEPVPVSPALCVIAEDNGMALSGLIGNDICFEPQDFARALNVSAVENIVITQTPDTAAGELRVGTTVVNAGQTISAASLSQMTYTARSKESTRATFRFRAEDAGYDMPCELYLLSKTNAAPTLSDVPESYLNVSTHRNITLYGTLPCFDPEGDSTRIEIVSYPQKGSLTLTNKATGEYTYTPTDGYSGEDSFVYVARDMYGNYSASARVSLKVTKPTVSMRFDDMENSPYYNAALSMAEAGIMSGTSVGSDTYFYPEGSVSRGEFVVMVLHAIGMEDVTNVSSTGFADDAQIPEYMKDYIATACSLGYIKGVQTEKGMCFEASREITRAEAAVMLGNILNLSTPTVLPVFNDAVDIPAWAAPSVYSLSAAGVFSATDGNISPLDSLTRGDAAVILTNLMNYLGR